MVQSSDAAAVRCWPVSAFRGLAALRSPVGYGLIPEEHHLHRCSDVPMTDRALLGGSGSDDCYVIGSPAGVGIVLAASWVTGAASSLPAALVGAADEPHALPALRGRDLVCFQDWSVRCLRTTAAP